MGTRRRSAAFAAAICLTVGYGCEQPTSPRTTLEEEDAQTSQATMTGARLAAGKRLDPALCAPSRGGFSPDSTNPYFPLRVGSRWLYQGEEDGETIGLQITVLAETELVAGVTTRVVEERETVDGTLSEVSRNFFAQASDGTVCYFGEEVDIYEDGQIVSHEGAWRADQQGNRPGIIMPAAPRPGIEFQMEGAPGVAEDEGRIVGIGPVDVPAGRFIKTVRVREFNPLDGGRDWKVYAAGVGLVIDGPLELVSYSL
jgi:hypothetical protein